MVQIQVKVDTNNLERAFAQKGAQVNSKIDELAKGITDAVAMWVRDEAPRKTGKLKAAVQGKTYGSRGIVFVSKGIAPHWLFVLEGTRAHTIVAKHKRALRVPGWGIFKSVDHPGTKANPFTDRGADKAQGDVDRKVAAFEKWLVEV